MSEVSIRNGDRLTERDTLGPVPIVFGATGHRDIPPEDFPKLEAAVTNQLNCIKNKYKNSRLVLLSGLAEGADRLVARCALACGWSLGGVLALPQAEFEKDFETEASVTEFRELLGRCEWVREVAPSGYSRPECYELVGEWISIHAQWLIALWDGTQNGKKGGTGCVVKLFREGRSEFRPVLPDTGPVIQIFTRRQSELSVADLRKVGKTKRLMPNPLRMGHSLNEGKRWTEVLLQIEAFNSSAKAHSKSDLNETRQQLNSNQSPQPDAALPSSARNASWLYAYADHMAGSLQKKRDWLFLFILALAIAGLGFEKFYSGPSEGIGWSGAVWLLVALVFGAVALLLAKLPTFLLDRLPIFFRETNYMDYRSLAEACRVQYFWKRAGMDVCAADFHLFDQRDELEWIRQAVRTTELGPNSSQKPLEKELLKNILDCWITDQRAYYFKQRENHKKKAGLLNKLALGLFYSSGLVMVVAILFQVGSDSTLIKWLQFTYGLLLTLSATTKVYLFTNGHDAHARSYLRMGQSMEVAEKMLLACLDNPKDSGAFVTHAQKILQETGKAALDENGDWLLLHREREIEPPIG